MKILCEFLQYHMDITVCFIITIFVCIWYKIRENALVEVSEKYCGQRYSYRIRIILITGNCYYFEWYSNCLFREMQELFRITCKERKRNLVFRYHGKEIKIDRGKIVLKEMEVKQEKKEFMI